eukprot:CAMPEP_0201722664 /NCGR_PEP_ID=MMETSP0593-20130828/6957_1 /ASSEMBLY_ACC=CAM_ASM_000672 /TAXON_ID=267983 /ORGANISM="Skeletonema japonicum, Strain CCMP2506" /LENGTH=1102 /DNA_ID=CAMNT_0048213643 /DNA_START=201 /DNA_END=3509 /DNA_ORIENTATION=+
MEPPTDIKSVQMFDIIYPLALSSKKDRYLPSKIRPSNRRRRVSVEVHKVIPPFEEDKQASPSSKKAERRGSPLSPRTRISQDYTNHNNKDTTTAPAPPEICYIKILMNTAANPIETMLFRTRKDKNDSYRGYKESDRSGQDSVVDSVACDYSLAEDTANSLMETSTNNNSVNGLGDWFAKYKVPLKRFDIVEKKKRTVIVSFLFRGLQYRREFIFDTEQEANRFCQVIENEKQLLGFRAKARLDAALGDIQLKEGERLSLLVDIVSATDLPTKSPDPYVIVRFQGKRIHKTEHISNSKNPIWTLRKGSLFILNVDALVLFEANDGLILEVKDQDGYSKRNSLGAVSVSPQTIYNWDGERKEFELKALSGETVYNEGTLALRIRRATDHDIEFLNKYNKSSKFEIKNVAGDILPTLETSGSALKKMMKVNKKTEMGKTKYLVRPGPDPKRTVETEWLTKEQIEEEALKPSHSWLDIGSGNLGKVFVEIIGCDGLPNMDTGRTFGNLTDAFVSVVYEDCFARTHTVDDCLSPRFMPWSRRAFILHMMHTSSQLFVGVFDSDPHTTNDDLIGRVSVDLTNLTPNVIYTMKYNLYASAKCNPREEKYGSITIRLRLELENQRTLLLSNIQYPESVYVNSNNKKDSKVMHKTVHGNVDMKKYGLANINQYIEELYDYLTIYYYLEDSFLSLIFWRGKSTVHIPVPWLPTLSIKWVPFSGPLHSLIAFLCLIRMVENPELIPTIFFGSIGWILMATMEFRTSGPDPWARCKSFKHYFWSLICGDGLITPHDIAPNENIERIREREGAWKKRVKDAERKAEEYAKEQEQYWKEMEERGDIDEDLSVVKNKFTLNPTTAYLYPIQQWLGIIINALRITKNIVIWEESYLSFWLAAVSFLLCVISLFVPWSLIVKWTMRITVYVFFGPWMMLLDTYYIQVDEAEESEHEDRQKSERQEYLADQILQAQILREDNTKLRDFKQYMFGEYITKVNIMKKDRFIDKPLPESSAVVYKPKKKSLGSLAMQEAGCQSVRVDGQQLVGTMIPRMYESPPAAPIGKPIKKIDDDIPNYNDSYSLAVAKVGTIIVGAAILSVYFVPKLLSYFVNKNIYV